MVSAKNIIKTAAIIPIKPLNLIHDFITFKTLLILFLAISSDNIHVVARETPEFAIVIKKPYTDITSVNIPKASEPILFEIYILKTKPSPRTNREDRPKKNPFIKINFDFLKLSPF